MIKEEHGVFAQNNGTCLHSKTGVITTKARLDRELKEDYSLDITVKDCFTPPMSARTTIKVRAEDINDNRPRFPYQSPMVLNVQEDFALNKNIFTFTATGI